MAVSLVSDTAACLTFEMVAWSAAWWVALSAVKLGFEMVVDLAAWKAYV